MITVDALQALLDSRITPLSPRRMPLEGALGQRLAEDVFCESDEPAFDRSAMDGFAVSFDATCGKFTIIGQSLPGNPIPSRLGRDQALRVFTGSALPPHVRVVMQENTTSNAGVVDIHSMSEATHVRLRGSAKRAGEQLLPKETPLTPAAIAILASAGIVTPLIYPRPTVGHLTTGSEIISPSQTPEAGQIRNTNAPLLRALLAEYGAPLLAQKHSGEDPHESLEQCKEPAMSGTDLLLISGGASGGAHDHTANVIKALGFELVCSKVNCRPGKPLLIGIKEDRVAVGLPGNPLSHFVTFHIFVRQILALLAGAPAPSWRHAILSGAPILASDPRETFWPARTTNDSIQPMPWLDSGHLSALLGVNALLRIAPNQKPANGKTVAYVPCGLP